MLFLHERRLRDIDAFYEVRDIITLTCFEYESQANNFAFHSPFPKLKIEFVAVLQVKDTRLN